MNKITETELNMYLDAIVMKTTEKVMNKFNKSEQNVMLMTIVHDQKKKI